MRYRPTKRAVAIGGGALLLFAVGTNVQAGWVLAIAALLLGVLVTGAVVPLRGLRGIEVVRRVPRTAAAGQTVSVGLAVTNTGRGLRGLIRVTDEFCGRAAAVVGVARPGVRREFRSPRSETRRGVHSSGPCTLETGAPFGVVQLRKTFTVSSPMIVHPKTYDVAPDRIFGRAGLRAPSSEGDITSVREYHPGDPLRHIHWRSSARRGALVVRDFDLASHSDLTIVASVPQDAEIADAVASVACSLALGATRAGDDVTLSCAREGSVRSARVRSVEGVLDWGARLDHDQLPFEVLLGSTGETGGVVCVCSSDDAPVGALSALASRTEVSVVLVESDGAKPDIAESSLQRAGIKVAFVDVGEVGTWFANGCVAS